MTSLIYAMVRLYNEREERLNGVVFGDIKSLLLRNIKRLFLMGIACSFLFIFAVIFIVLLAVLTPFTLILTIPLLFAFMVPLALMAPIYLFEDISLGVLYRSTLVPPPSFSRSVASPSLVVPSCTPITAPFKSVLLLICLSASDAPEPHATKSTLRSKVKKPSLNFSVFLYFIIPGIRLLLFQILSTHLCTSFSVYASRYDSACITSTFATWEESLDADMLQGFAVTDDADRR